MEKTPKKMPAVEQEPRVKVYLPLLEDEGAAGSVDQTVPITINGKTLIIKRGEKVELPVSYYIVLKESGKFPNL